MRTNVDGRRKLYLCYNLIFVYFDNPFLLINRDIVSFFPSDIKPVNRTVIFLLCFRPSIDDDILLELIANSIGLSTVIVPEMGLIDFKYTIKDFDQEDF